MFYIHVLRLLTIFLFLQCFSPLAYSEEKVGYAEGSASNGRYLAVISDLHMGIGRHNVPNRIAWHPTEDFRWPNALQSFLRELSKKGNHSVDLVIAGDLFELWQPPDHIKCVGVSADLGCTVEEMVEIAKVVAFEHANELRFFAEFAESGDNRVYIIPGNHDSTLLLNEIWQVFSEPLRVPNGRISLVNSGIWTSNDGRVVIEHGHQIGSDVNKYDRWPEIVRTQDDVRYVIRPWGENFVQHVFNKQEYHYPIIDNLSPETAGVRYRMADRGVWGTAADMAKFLVFNLFETSVSQKIASLGRPKKIGEKDNWDINLARTNGHKLFTYALHKDDPFLQNFLSEDDEVKAIQMELSKLLKDMDEEDVFLLCDLAALNSIDGWKLCRDEKLGSLTLSLIPDNIVLRYHLKKRVKDYSYKKMNVFIYGHTHQMVSPKELSINSSHRVTWLNSGAFQRLINEEGFLKRVKEKEWSVQEGLKNLNLDDLSPCYGVVLVPYSKDGLPDPKTMMWWMPNDANEGRFISPSDKLCQ